MEQVLVPFLVVLTSFAAVVVGIRGLGLSAGGIGRAIRKMLEGIGIALIFLGAHILAGIAVILATRALTGGFVSMYHVADVTLLPLSVFQGLAFHWWRALSLQGLRGPSPSPHPRAGRSRGNEGG